MYRVDAFAEALDLGLAGVCHACLSFVSFALDDGDRAEVAREVRRVTPTLWFEGLDVQILAAVKKAVALGVEGAEAALADLERDGPRSAIARAAVVRLGRDLSRRTRTEMAAYRAARDRLSLAPPELN